MLDGPLATSNVGVLKATSLELGVTLAQTTSLDGGVLQEGGTLSGLSLNIVARVGRDNAGQTSQTGEKSSSANHCCDWNDDRRIENDELVD